MNIIAGLLIGYSVESWLALIVIALVWALVYSFYISLFHKPRIKQYIDHCITTKQKKKLGMSYIQLFYFTELLTALSTFIIIATITKLVKGFF